MAKSNYPDKLDTSVEIPVIRDNITEIGSDVLNSLRSAIFNIEKTLGINPQGAIGNTVAARLSNAMDDNGNITKEALDRANLLSGPITDSDVSKTAAINESKLRLNYPTTLLQDEISILDSRLALFIETLEELNRILSAHVHLDAINRHRAQAITVVAAEVDESALSTRSLEDGTLQEALEILYNEHIHYTGEAVDQNNNSHNSNQIYYDNDKTSDLIPSGDVQGAIDDLADLEGTGLRNSILNLNSNGIIRTGSVYDALEGNETGGVIVSESEIAYTGPSGSSSMYIAFPDEPTPVADVKPFDILEILTSPDEDDNAEYIIMSVVLTPGEDLDYVEIFGGPLNAFTTGTTAQIKKSIYTNYNENGLNCSARPRSGFSNTPSIQVAPPNSATVISSGMRASNVLDGSTDTLAIEIDEGDAVEINVFNSSYDTQSLDIIVATINQYCVDNNLNIFAYKLRSLKCFELAITHVMPNNSSDVKNRTLKIVDASSNDAAEALGLDYLKDRLIEGSAGNSFHINGRIIEDYGKITKYGADSVSIGAGTVEINSTAVDFITDGLRVGDLCVIEGSSDSDDDGTRSVMIVEEDKITLDYTGSTLQGELSDESAIFFLRSTASVSELEFLESWESVISDGLIMLDVFIDETANLFYRRRIDIAGHMNIANFYAVVTDVSQGFIGQDIEYTLTVDTSGMASIKQEPAGISGPETFVGATGIYKVYSLDKMEYIVLSVYVPNASITPFGVGILESSLFGYGELPSSVLHLCRAVYSPEFGVIIEAPHAGLGGSGALSITDKRSTGTVDDTIVGDALLERYIQGPRNELRGSGIIRDIDVEEIIDNGDDTCSITINPGVSVVNGTRFEYLGVDSLIYNYTNGSTENFYIGLDAYGCLVIGNEVDPDMGTDYISPFASQNVAHIAYVEIDTLTVTDLRLFVDHLDYKIIADITVANDQRFGHFTDIKTAVDYARMFSKMFPDMGTPSVLIKEGRYYIKEQINVNFGVKISGEGPNTVLQRDESYPPGLSGGVYGIGSPIFVIGDHEYAGTDDIGRGVTLERFTYESDFSSFDSDLTDTVISIRVSVDSTNPILRFNDINYIGSESASITSGSTSSTGYEMPFALNSGSTGAASGNIIISNCLFVRAGFGQGPILIFEDSLLQNTIIRDNIVVDSIYSSDGINPDYDMVFVSFSPSLAGYIEAGNAMYPLVT